MTGVPFEVILTIEEEEKGRDGRKGKGTLIRRRSGISFDLQY